MKRLMLAFLVVLGVSGCKDSRVDGLIERVTALETAHNATRGKLQELLVWVNHKNPPAVGLYDWMGAVHTKLWPGGGPTDPIQPAPPPPPF